MTYRKPLLDAAGNPTSGGADGIARYDRAVDLLLRYHPHVLDAADELATNDAGMPMAQAFLAYLSLMSTDAPDVENARASAATLQSLELSDREAAHAAAITAWLDGRWRDAARVLDQLLIRWPTDMLALVMGHLIDFFTGDSRMIRDRIARALPFWDAGMPGYHAVLGMHAFGLEETGDYTRAERAGPKTVRRP